jgi:hypothetical protein
MIRVKKKEVPKLGEVGKVLTKTVISGQPTKVGCMVASSGFGRRTGNYILCEARFII